MTEIVNMDAALTICAGYQSILNDVMNAFYLEAPKMRNNIKEYYENKDWKNFHIQIHGLKNASTSAGALALSEIAKKMEQEVKDMNYSGLDAFLPEFLDLYEKTMNWFEENGELYGRK